jgi:hypothetical protein
MQAVGRHPDFGCMEMTYNAAREAVRRYRRGRVPGEYSSGLSVKSVRNVHVVMQRSLADAVLWGTCTRTLLRSSFCPGSGAGGHLANEEACGPSNNLAPSFGLLYRTGTTVCTCWQLQPACADPTWPASSGPCLIWKREPSRSRTPE